MDTYYPKSYALQDKITTYLDDKLDEIERCPEDKEKIMAEVEKNVPEDDYEEFKRDIGEML